MNRDKILGYLRGENDEELFARSAEVRSESFGEEVYFRGLVELSNVCACNCLYCGIRKSNHLAERYTLDLQTVKNTVAAAYEDGYRAVVLQCGELRSDRFTQYITDMVRMIKELSRDEIVITLSCGEQSEEVYRTWREAGADKYLLRIESSDPVLFAKIHPAEIDYTERKNRLYTLSSLGFMTGTGVMIGLPHQTVETLADDLIFISDSRFGMCGMGPYIEHKETPLFAQKSNFSTDERVTLTLRMIAILRIMRPDMNIASSTALGSLRPAARISALKIGANVIMPNITPTECRKNYDLYEGKISDLDLSKVGKK